VALHEDPGNDYERMLDVNDLDCWIYGCWNPIAAIVDIGSEHIRVCREHIDSGNVVHYLET